MLSNILDLLLARDLISAWTGRTIRGRYQQSVLGWLWAVVQPAASVAIFSIIFTQIIPVDTGDVPYPVFAYVAVVPWTFLASSLTDMSNSLVQNMALVTKIYFPREILPIAAMLARLLDFFVAASLLVVLMLIFRVSPNLPGWLFLPLILAIQLALVIGLGLAASALNVFFRDIQPLLTLGIQLWFYATPIVYPISLVPEPLLPFYYLNPMTGIIESYRDVLLYHSTPGFYLPTAALVSMLILFVGYWYFKRVEHQFADII